MMSLFFRGTLPTWSMVAIVLSTVWPEFLAPTLLLVSSTRRVTLWRSAPAAPSTGCVSTATGLFFKHTLWRDSEFCLRHFGIFCHKIDTVLRRWQHSIYCMDRSPYCALLKNRFGVCSARSQEKPLSSSTQTQIWWYNCCSRVIIDCVRICFMYRCVRTVVISWKTKFSKLRMFLTLMYLFFRMEQNECECPCECPLEVNECTGNLTNAENRSVECLSHNTTWNYIYIH